MKPITTAALHVLGLLRQPHPGRPTEPAARPGPPQPRGRWSATKTTVAAKAAKRRLAGKRG